MNTDEHRYLMRSMLGSAAISHRRGNVIWELANAVFHLRSAVFIWGQFIAPNSKRTTP